MRREGIKWLGRPPSRSEISATILQDVHLNKHRLRSNPHPATISQFGVAFASWRNHQKRQDNPETFLIRASQRPLRDAGKPLTSRHGSCRIGQQGRGPLLESHPKSSDCSRRTRRLAFNDAPRPPPVLQSRAYDELADHRSHAPKQRFAATRSTTSCSSPPLLSWSRFRDSLHQHRTCGRRQPAGPPAGTHTGGRRHSPSPTSCSAPTSCRLAIVQRAQFADASVRPRSRTTRPPHRPGHACGNESVRPTPATCWRPSRFPGRGALFPLATAGLFARTRPGAVAGAGRRLRGPDAARLCA